MFKIKVTGPRRFDLDVPIACPSCGHVIKLKARTAAPGTHVPCPGCGITIELTGDDLRKVQKSLDGLLDTISRIGR